MPDDLLVEVTAVIDFRYNGSLWETGRSDLIPEDKADALHDAGFVRFSNPENAKPVPPSGVIDIKPKSVTLGTRDTN